MYPIILWMVPVQNHLPHLSRKSNSLKKILQRLAESLVEFVKKNKVLGYCNLISN